MYLIKTSSKEIILLEVMDHLESVIVVDGTACLGKTSVLKKINLGYSKVVIADFAEDVQLYPIFKNKNTDGAIEITYTIFQMTKLRVGSIHDRGPIGAFAYSWIFAIIERRRSLQQTKDIPTQFPIQMWEMFRKMKTIIVLESDPQACLGRVLKRNNGIDVMTGGYVCTQNEVFKLIAGYIGAKILTRLREEEMDVWISRLEREIILLQNEDIRE